MYYRISVAPGGQEGKQLQVLREMLSTQPEARALSEQLQQWLQEKSCRTRPIEPDGMELQA
jgi:hypothetical protein